VSTILCGRTSGNASTSTPTRTPHDCPLMCTLCLSKRGRHPRGTGAKSLIRLSAHILCCTAPSKVSAEPARAAQTLVAGPARTLPSCLRTGHDTKAHTLWCHAHELGMTPMFVHLVQTLVSGAVRRPVLSSTAVWSLIPQPNEIGREEALFRRKDHRLPA